MNRQPVNLHGNGISLDGPLDELGESEESELRLNWEVHKEVSQYLTVVLGIPPILEPEHTCPALTPAMLTNPNSDEFITSFAKRSGWLSYVQYQRAGHAALLLQIKAEMEDIERTLRMRMQKHTKRVTKTGDPKPPTAAEVQDRVRGNTRYRELMRKHLYHTEILTYLDAWIVGKGGEHAVQSRVVEVRRQEFDGSRRSTNIAGAGGIPRTPSNNGFQRRAYGKSA